MTTKIKNSLSSYLRIWHLSSTATTRLKTLFLIILCLSMVSCGNAAIDGGNADDLGESHMTGSGIESGKSVIRMDDTITPEAQNALSGVIDDSKAGTGNAASGTKDTADVKAVAGVKNTNDAASEAEKTLNGAKSPADSENQQITSGHRLSVSGTGVNKEIHFTLSELKKLPGKYSGDFFALNNYGTKTYFNFEGIQIKSILDAAGIKKTAGNVTIVAEDGYEQKLSLSEALKTDYIDEQNPDVKYPVIIAWKENGDEYDPEDGLPFRFVMGQSKAGDINKPKWVSNVQKIIVD